MYEISDKIPSCFYCRDKGAEGGCTHCGKTVTESVREVMLPDGSLDYLDVPKYYRGREWSGVVLRENHRELEGDLNFDNFVKDCDKFRGIFARGRIPSASHIFVAPRSFGKMILIYDCMQLVKKSGRSTIRLLDTQQLKRLLTLSMEKPNSKELLNLGVSYDEFLHSDVVFCVVDKGYMRRGSFEIIDWGLDVRSRMDKTIHFFSRYSLEECSEFDYNKRFHSTYNRSLDSNRKRYPVITQYIDKTMKGGIYV